jgi:hypothetical protein
MQESWIAYAKELNCLCKRIELLMQNNWIAYLLGSDLLMQQKLRYYLLIRWCKRTKLLSRNCGTICSLGDAKELNCFVASGWFYFLCSMCNCSVWEEANSIFLHIHTYKLYLDESACLYFGWIGMPLFLNESAVDGGHSVLEPCFACLKEPRKPYFAVFSHAHGWCMPYLPRMESIVFFIFS